MDIKLDEWQEKVLKTKGHLVLRTGRQVGKSTVVAIKAGEYAAKNKKKTILVIASVERQAQLLFEKTLNHVQENYGKMIKKGKDRPTKHRIKLTNGSTIYCLPTGLTGHGIRGYTIDLLIADEAAFIPEEVWTAVTPMISVTGGDMILLSTPFGKGGFFYNCFSRKDFTAFHISSEECPRIPKEFLKIEKENMTELQYAQEYRGEFIDELRQLFKDKLINERCILKEETPPAKEKKYLGVDIARLGGDETTLIGLSKTLRKLKMFKLIIFKLTRTTETSRRILEEDKKDNYHKIYLDDGGIGGAVLDNLLEQEQTKRKVEGLNNKAKPLDYEGKQKKRILKEDLYTNLLWLMESGQIDLLNNEKLKMSLRSVQFEYCEDGSIKIFGKYTHIVEGLIRAAWCIKDKTLNIIAHSF